MSLTIRNNLLATNTARNLSQAYGALATSTRRLSSGLRIGTAADDPAGLAVRETMRSDIASLNQGVRNANDAISMVQVADGALQVIDEKLVRMKELAMQAATGTYTSDQRLIIDSEFQAMSSEINRICSDTEFNGIKLLKLASGTNGQSSENGLLLHLTFDNVQTDSSSNNYTTTWTGSQYGAGVVGTSAAIFNGGNNDFTINNFSANLSKFTVQFWINTNDPNSYHELIASYRAAEDGKRYELQTESTNHLMYFYTNTASECSATADNTLTPNAWNLITSTYDSGTYKIYINGNIAATSSVGTGPVLWDADTYLAHDPLHGGEDYVGKMDDLRVYNYALSNATIQNYYSNPASLDASVSITSNAGNENSIKIHFGTGNDSNEDYYYIKTNDVMSQLNISGLRLQTQSNAQSALDRIGTAVVNKDKIRADLGATQNRLLNTISNLQIQSENLQSSESKISDVDYSQEMTEFVRSQIISQTATAMLAQANSLPRMALQLMQG